MGRGKTLAQIFDIDKCQILIFLFTDGPEDMDEPGGVTLAHVMGKTQIQISHTNVMPPTHCFLFADGPEARTSRAV